MISNPLYDKEFLNELFSRKKRWVYARVTALTQQEKPIEYIEGKITGGTINIDGASIVRRTCSLSMVAQDVNINDFYWGVKNKFKLEVGLKNEINPKYPDIIWFKQGIYLITSFNTSRSTSSLSISISGKDKMALLNGDIGGNVNASTDFGQIEEESENGVWTIRKIPVQEIIRNAVHTYANEPYWNIIINDLDTYGLELMEYRYDTPFYLYRKVGTYIYDNALMENDAKMYYYDKACTDGPYSLKQLDKDHLDNLTQTMVNNKEPKPVYVKDNDNEYIFAKISYGDTAGYRITDLTYAGDLIANIGDTITSVLDKIRSMLVEFEYFYNVDGQFVFQKKQSFVSTMWTPLESDQYGNQYIAESLAVADSRVYNFQGSEMITSFSNNPNLQNMKNDYSIWGQRETVSGATVPVHLRYAIDIKPTRYVSVTVANSEVEDYNKKYGTKLKGQVSIEYTTDKYDWREIIYQMAIDYFKYNILDNFELKVGKANPEYPTGKTGYEQYYTDMEGFWRQLYDPSLPSEDYYSDPSSNYLYWNKAVYNAPETLNFWFDFLDSGGELMQYNAHSIGTRPKPVNETTIKSIYFRETPNVIFRQYDSEDITLTGYRYIQVKDIDTMFSISAQGKSAKDRLDELIYQYGYCTESVNLSTIPIYYLEPNIRIHIRDEEVNIDGDYVVTKMTIPLAYNGTMSMTATKAADYREVG